MSVKITTKTEIRFGDDRVTAVDLKEYLQGRGLDSQLSVTDYGWTVVSRCSPREMHQLGAAIKELIG